MTGMKLENALAETKAARQREAVRAQDEEAQIHWQKLLELAWDMPPQLAQIAAQRAPEASAWVLPGARAELRHG